jgi:anaphase-promoting complex subunit 10
MNILVLVFEKCCSLLRFSLFCSLRMTCVVPNVVDICQKRELGDEAVWSISTAKPGNGVEQLRDNNTETYWQSDGSQPHTISIQFLRKVFVSDVCLYLDYNLDESYAPKKINIRCGTSFHDLVDVVAIELTDPTGWTIIDLPCDVESGAPLRTHLLQVQIVSMHQNGRDTHVRQAKLYGPRISPRVMGNFSLDMFKTIDMQQYALLR